MTGASSARGASTEHRASPSHRAERGFTVTDLVEVELLAPDRFRAKVDSPLERRTLFGGSLLGQALRAAAASTDPDKNPQSLHATFVRAGQAGTDVEFRVTRTRDGRAFSTRHVTASQGERVLMTMTASFHRDEPSRDYQRPVVTWTPCPDDATLLERAGRQTLGVDYAEMSDPADTEYVAWARSQEPLPDDQALHACILAFLSDNGAPGVAAAAVGLRAGGPDREYASGPMTTSLDHAMWFHRPGRCDDWVRVSAVPLSTAGSRGLLLGGVHDRSGVHLATFVQEMLIRADA